MHKSCWLRRPMRSIFAFFAYAAFFFGEAHGVDALELHPTDGDLSALLSKLPKVLSAPGARPEAIDWLEENLDKTDARFAALLMEETFQSDPEHGVRWLYVTLAWSLQDAAECVDTAAAQKAVQMAWGAPEIIDYAKSNPKKDVAALSWALDWIAARPSPSDARWLCEDSTGDLAQNPARTEVEDGVYVKDPSDRPARQRAIWDGLAEELKARRAALDAASIAPKTEFELVRRIDGIPLYETGLVVKWRPEVLFGPNSEVLFPALDTDTAPRTPQDVEDLSRRGHSMEALSADALAEAQRGRRLWDAYYWRPGLDEPRLLYDGAWTRFVGSHEGEIGMIVGCDAMHSEYNRCARERLVVGLPDAPREVSRRSPYLIFVQEKADREWVHERFSGDPDYATYTYFPQNNDLFVYFAAPVRRNSSAFRYEWYDAKEDDFLEIVTKRDNRVLAHCGFGRDAWKAWSGRYHVRACDVDGEGFFSLGQGFGNCKLATPVYEPGGAIEVLCFDLHPFNGQNLFKYLVKGGLVTANPMEGGGRALLFHPDHGGARVIDVGQLGLPRVSPNGCVVVFARRDRPVGAWEGSHPRVTLRAFNTCMGGER